MQTIKTQVVPQFHLSINDALDGFARRALDIFASVLGLLFLAPAFAVIAIVIRRDSPGPVFYRGPRIGKNGRHFGILKFRTMYEQPESYQGPRITASGDKRITPLGKWLRETKINELPQLWNVLVGDMSLVGPRPEDPEIAQSWPLHQREVLLSVRPGVTSPATVMFRSEEELLNSASVMDEYLRAILPNKLRIDMLYIQNRSLLTDLDVIFMTLVMLLPRLRRHEVPESLLYWGPLSQFVSRYLTWSLVDILIAQFALLVAGVIWRLDGPLNIGWDNSAVMSLIFGMCFIVTNTLFGLKRIEWRRAPASAVFPLALSTLMGTAAMVLIDLLLFGSPTQHIQASNPPMGMIIIAGMLAFFGFVASRYRERLLTALAQQWLSVRNPRRLLGERVLIVGAGGGSQFAVWLLTRSDLTRFFSIVGMVDDDPRKQGMLIEGCPVLGSTHQISRLVAQHDIGLVFYTISNIDDASRRRILNDCRAARVQIAILPDVITELRDYLLFGERIYLPQTAAVFAED